MTRSELYDLVWSKPVRQVPAGVVSLHGDRGDRSRRPAVLRARQDKYCSHDPAALAADHTADGVVHSPLFPSLKGRQEIEQAYTALFRIFPVWSLAFDEPIVDVSGRVAHACSVTATHRGELLGMAGTGRRVKSAA